MAKVYKVLGENTKSCYTCEYAYPSVIEPAECNKMAGHPIDKFAYYGKTRPLWCPLITNDNNSE